MKQLFFLLLLTLPLSSIAHADETSKRAKIEELIQLTKLDQLLSQTSSQMTTRMKQSAAQQNARHAFTPEQQKAVDSYIAQIQTITQGAVSWDKIKPMVVQVYSETYTDQELDGILAFYHSPAGQALIAKSPQLMNRTMQLVNTQINEVQPQIQKANEDFSLKMKELSSSPAATPAPAPKSSTSPKQ
ncbi:MAG TPA: DUF2059 domain-containing protein [Edaphobacter sp.]